MSCFFFFFSANIEFKFSVKSVSTTVKKNTTTSTTITVITITTTITTTAITTTITKKKTTTTQNGSLTFYKTYQTETVRTSWLKWTNTKFTESSNYLNFLRCLENSSGVSFSLWVAECTPTRIAAILAPAWRSQWLLRTCPHSSWLGKSSRNPGISTAREGQANSTSLLKKWHFLVNFCPCWC